MIAPKFVGPCLQHISEHLVMLYATWASDLVSTVTGQDPEELMSNDPEVMGQLDKLLAAASAKVIPYASDEFNRIAPALQQLHAMLQQFSPPPPVDPAQVALQSAQAETARRAKNDSTQADLSAAKLDQQKQNDAERNAIAAERNQITQQNAETAAATRLKQTAIQAQTAEDTALLNLKVGHLSHMTDGASLGG
jgi:flagellar biosynthesis GTPase FlhF